MVRLVITGVGLTRVRKGSVVVSWPRLLGK